MQAYSKAYLDEVVENQGKLFDLYAQDYPNNDTEDFIQAYMKSKTRKYIDESGSVDKRSLSFRFKVNPAAVSEARYFYYSVDGSSFAPLENIKYLGNGLFDAHISWVFDPYANRRLEVLCSRLNMKSVQNNKATTFKDFIQDYSADMVIPDVES